MIRICLIGDSHLAALQAATAGHAMRETRELTFFGCHVEHMHHMVLSGRSLVSTNDVLSERLRQYSGGLDCIDIDAYDEFVVIGHGFALLPLIYHYQYFVADSMKGPTEGKYLLSDACFVSMGEAACQRMEGLRLAAAIRSVCGKPITVVPNPSPGAGLAEEQTEEWFRPHFSVVRNGDDAVLAALFRQICERLAIRNNVKIVPPLAEAAANGVFNLVDYSNLGEETNEVHLMNAMMHANTAYGALLLPHVFGPVP
jgi:hypothetical protein